MMLRSVLPLIAGLACTHFVAEAALRGVDPEKSRFYAGSDFTCMDGTKTIPASQLNDNYCDCADGSDEPGTSACYRGKFWCRNYGHEPQLLASSFVDDGVCDCCDGSDERYGCINTCLEAGTAKRQELRDRATEYASSLDKKAAYVEEAKTKRADWIVRLGQIDGEVAEQRESIPGLEADVVRLEGEKAERERLKVEQAAKDALEEAKLAAEEAAFAEKKAAEAAAAGVPVEGEEPVQSEEVHNVEAHGEETQEQEETDEERGRRIASQWTHDPDAALPTEEAAGEVSEQAEHLSTEELSHDAEYEAPLEGDEPYSGEEHHHDDAEHEDFEAPPHQHHHQESPYRHHSACVLPPGIEWSEVKQHAAPDDHTDLGHARVRVAAAKLKISKLEKEKVDLQRWSRPGIDWGPDDVWMAMAGKCFKDVSARWTYKACFYDQATQSEGDSNVVIVGMWRGFENGHATAVFDQGNPCAPPHPPRSYKVALHCANTEKLYNSMEPSVCGYTAVFTTPIMCNHDEYDGILRSIADLEELEADVRREIERDRQQREVQASQGGTGDGGAPMSGLGDAPAPLHEEL